jgi:uncharacterized membrane protein
MTDSGNPAPWSGRAIRHYLLYGVITVLPIWITWLIFEFIFRLLSRIGHPAVGSLARMLETSEAEVAGWMMHPATQSVIAVAITLASLCGLGFLATRVLGRRLIEWIEGGLERLPVVQTIYGSTKRLLEALHSRPEGVQRVVLIAFPTPGMKAVGLVTRTFNDPATGKEIAAVYVPTTPNPTSGYLELVPIEDVTQTDWSLDEAMSFIVTGGAAGPDRIPYAGSLTAAPPNSRDTPQ